MSFLSVFRDVFHGMEVAAQVGAPIVSTVDPGIGSIMKAATNTAVLVEGTIDTPGTGAQKQALVQQSTQALVDATNQILQAAGKKPLPANTTNVAVAQAVAVVGQLNGIKAAVATQPGN